MTENLSPLEQEKIDLNNSLVPIGEALKSQADGTEDLLESLKAIPAEGQKPDVLKNAEELNNEAFSLYSTFKQMLEDYNKKAPELNTREEFLDYRDNVIVPILVAIQKRNGGDNISNE